mmetsp:Transcript_28136/g.110643  ORF Transcript_28136/g.110643 Transcript_28136/m.110643 type:complete len:89 (-) Transcript_28136:673-939(-)
MAEIQAESHSDPWDGQVWALIPVKLSSGTTTLAKTSSPHLAIPSESPRGSHPSLMTTTTLKTELLPGEVEGVLDVEWVTMQAFEGSSK